MQLVDTIDLYAYARSNPISMHDPEGTRSIPGLLEYASPALGTRDPANNYRLEVKPQARHISLGSRDPAEEAQDTRTSNGPARNEEKTNESNDGFRQEELEPETPGYDPPPVSEEARQVEEELRNPDKQRTSRKPSRFELFLKQAERSRKDQERKRIKEGLDRLAEVYEKKIVEPLRLLSRAGERLGEVVSNVFERVQIEARKRIERARILAQETPFDRRVREWSEKATREMRRAQERRERQELEDRRSNLPPPGGSPPWWVPPPPVGPRIYHPNVVR